MTDLFNDEMSQMDEREFAETPQIAEAVSVDDPISSLELQKMVVIASGTKVADALNLFQTEGVGCVLVQENDKLIGIFTERDVIWKLAGKGLDYSSEEVDKFMTKEPDVLHMDDPIAFALNRMTDGGYRHVPIVNDDGRPMGIVGILDIVKHLATFYSDEVMNLPPSPVRGAQDRPEGG
ncbi:MAG: CBS domain-containing protein [Fidelibacterota bacterium]